MKYFDSRVFLRLDYVGDAITAVSMASKYRDAMGFLSDTVNSNSSMLCLAWFRTEVPSRNKMAFARGTHMILGSSFLTSLPEIRTENGVIRAKLAVA